MSAGAFFAQADMTGTVRNARTAAVPSPPRIWGNWGKARKADKNRPSGGTCTRIGKGPDWPELLQKAGKERKPE